VLVNNDHDLNACRNEIGIAVSINSTISIVPAIIRSLFTVFFYFIRCDTKQNLLTGHKHCINLVDYAINNLGEGVHEVLMLMTYYSGSVYKAMNVKLKESQSAASFDLSGYFDESKVLKIFCDVCEAVANLHALQPPVIHRDLKVMLSLSLSLSLV
jgi:serine/threonine protein kinase